MIEKHLIKNVCKKLSEGLSVVQDLPHDGFMYIEKLLPYICVYRYKEERPRFAGLLKSQASYLIVDGSVDISELLEAVSTTISEKLNAFLILEMWPIEMGDRPIFEIYCPKGRAPATVAALQEGFDGVKGIYRGTGVKLIPGARRHPESLPPLMDIDESKESGSLIIGIAIPLLYQSTETNEVYFLFYRKFYSRFSEIIKRAAHEFIRVQTSNPFDHYLMLGKTKLDQVTLRTDSELAKISEEMSFLLRTTPVNSASEWEKFQKNGFSKEPSFNYRLIALDPEKKKRDLYNLPMDQIEDPTIAFLLRERRLEIEKQLTMLEERGTDNFRFIGESLYGKVPEHVVSAAEAILKQFPSGDNPRNMKRIDCHEFARRAKMEIDYYREQFPNVKTSLKIRKDVAGILVSKGELLISDRFSLDEDRCDALIQHEVATHILTYCNGRAQTLKQMYTGLAGYDRLQEGLAVLSEYLVGGLTVNRMRTLAGRVIAAVAMVKGAGFIEIFDLLRINRGFSGAGAFNITMRVFRGGGLTKDTVYLAGLMDVMEYLQKGGKLETLYTGKFNMNQVGLIEELLHRRVLREPVLPRFLEREPVQGRLKELRCGVEVIDLLK